MKRIILKYLNRNFPLVEGGYRDMSKIDYVYDDMVYALVKHVNYIFDDDYNILVNNWCKEFQYKFYFKKGSVECWRKNNQWHREDGPAKIFHGDGEEWWLNGLRHRVDGPAVTYADGKKKWYRHGKLIFKHGKTGFSYEISRQKFSY